MDGKERPDKNIVEHVGKIGSVWLMSWEITVQVAYGIRSKEDKIGLASAAVQVCG